MGAGDRALAAGLLGFLAVNIAEVARRVERFEARLERLHAEIAASLAPAVPQPLPWTGAHAAVLRRALRMTNEEFAGHLGIAPRTVSHWNAHPDHVPMPELQRALDTSLHQAAGPARERFALMLNAPV